MAMIGTQVTRVAPTRDHFKNAQLTELPRQGFLKGTLSEKFKKSGGCTFVLAKQKPFFDLERKPRKEREEFEAKF